MTYTYINERDIDRLQSISLELFKTNLDAFKRRIEHYPYVKIYVFNEEQNNPDLILIDKDYAEALTLIQWYHTGQNINIDGKKLL